MGRSTSRETPSTWIDRECRGRDVCLLSARLAWGLGLLFLSGAGFRKARSGAAGTAPMISSLGEPFSRHPEVLSGFAMSAELVIPFFIVFGFQTRFAATVGAIHFAVATYAHLVAWGQPFRAVIISETDPSGIGSLCWMLVSLFIVNFGPGRLSLDQRIQDGPGDSYKPPNKVKHN